MEAPHGSHAFKREREGGVGGWEQPAAHRWRGIGRVCAERKVQGAINVLGPCTVLPNTTNI